MISLITIFSSNIPIDCHIIKGRLETDGLDCYIFDENIVLVHPFKAVAVGGVKLKVPSDQTTKAEKIIGAINSGRLYDNEGEYDLRNELESEIKKQNEILEIRTLIRNNPIILEKKTDFNSKLLNHKEIELIIESEKKQLQLAKKKLNFTLKQFWYELFDFDRSVFKYLRTKPVEFYIEKDIILNFNSQNKTESKAICPNCKSENVNYGYAIDYKWDIPYLIFSFLISVPFPLYRKSYHCFDCGFNFKYFNKRQQVTNAKK